MMIADSTVVVVDGLAMVICEPLVFFCVAIFGRDIGVNGRWIEAVGDS
jgi:hypothetical protein